MLAVIQLASFFIENFDKKAYLKYKSRLFINIYSLKLNNSYKYAIITLIKQGGKFHRGG